MNRFPKIALGLGLALSLHAAAATAAPPSDPHDPPFPGDEVWYCKYTFPSGLIIVVQQPPGQACEPEYFGGALTESWLGPQS